jgi:hypothetical protein
MARFIVSRANGNALRVELAGAVSLANGNALRVELAGADFAVERQASSSAAGETRGA